MRRVFMLIAAVGLAVGLAGGAAGHPPTVGEAEAMSAPPEILLARWDKKPRVGPEALLRVIAHDPDGVVWDVAVWWGDRSFSLASTYCVEGKSIGEPVRVLVGHEYAKPGTYTVRVQVTSYPSCDAVNVDHELSKKARFKVKVDRQ